MWRLVIYDLMENDEPAIAICEMKYRGEYEMYNHFFDGGSYRARSITDVEKDTMEAFQISLPVKPITDFCLNPRHCEWSGVEY